MQTGCAGTTASLKPSTSNSANSPSNSMPTIGTQPANQSVIIGHTATFAVTASGPTALSYQWSKNGAAIAGATAASYTTPAAATTDNGSQFTVLISDAAGTTNSAPATLTVTASPTAPAISAQPLSQTVAVGQTATFSVAATGTSPLSYQWSKNGAAISGATAASYTTPAAASTDNGSQFAVTVSNSVSTLSSSSATLTVTTTASQLNENKNSLSFGSVNVGSNSVQAVTLTNAGNSNVTVSKVSISGAGFTAAGVSTGQTLTPGQTVTLNLTFAPSAAATVSGTVTVTSNAANSPAVVALSGVGAQAAAQNVTLSWTASPSGVSGYNVYRSTVLGGPYAKLDSSTVSTTQFVDSSVQTGQTYFYVVTSVDSSNLESAYSNVATATIPAS